MTALSASWERSNTLTSAGQIITRKKELHRLFYGSRKKTQERKPVDANQHVKDYRFLQYKSENRTAKEIVDHFINNGMIIQGLCVKEIIKRVSRETGVSVDLIIGPRQLARVTASRYAAIVIVSMSRPDLSALRVAMFFNRQRRTTFDAFNSVGLKMESCFTRRLRKEVKDG